MSKDTRQNLHKYNEQFKEILSSLNDAQRAAVEQIDGPVLVVAGPGTGKTHILTTRIGRILLETDAQPYNILCLTFTEAGVHAMRERLIEFIGPEAHRVHIFTFHSFCNNIIQDNLELFGRNDLEPLSDLERVELIRRILEELDIEHPLKRGRADIYFYEEHLYNLFQMMKAEGWTVEYVLDQIDAYLEGLPDRKEFVYQINRGEFKKGDLKQAKVDDAIERMNKLRAATQLFGRFEQLMWQYRRYDFADMILWVLRAFEKNEALLRSYQEQYLYFLIDEYQDTNGAQNEIVQKLIEYWPNPNIFIVGDDDQSIYEFQGARLKNLTDFYDYYQEYLQLVVLKENYRSSQPILNVSKKLITLNERRIVNNLKSIGVDKNLKASNEEVANLNIPPNILEYPNRLQEDVGIVKYIEDLQSQGFPLNEIAIIYAKHKQVRNIITLLEKKEIPYNTRRKVNILDLPLIRNLRLFLEYLNAEFHKPYSGEAHLFKILHFDFLGINPHDLARIALHIAQLGYENRPKWRDVLIDDKFLKERKLSNTTSIKKWADLFNKLLQQYQNIPVPVLVERIINRSGLLQTITQSDNKIWHLQVLNTFVEFVKKETDRHPRLTIGRLLDTFKNMDANRLAIEIQKTTISEEGVNLLTAHSSKGLEFRKVFIIDCTSDNWEPRKRQSSFRFSMPDTLTFSGEEDALEARRRLFYVAMTRAKEQIYLSYAASTNEQKDLQRVIFIDEILKGYTEEVLEKEVCSFEKINLPQTDLIEAQSILLVETAPKVEAQNKDTINAILEDFSLSVSSMNKFLRCPLSFYYENILGVPVIESEMAAYGTAMHNALQKGFEKMLYSKSKNFPSAMEFVQFFEQEMNKAYGKFNQKDFKRRFEMGRLHLKSYVDQHRSSWTKKVKLEHRITDAEIGGVPINGTIDRLELLPDQKAHLVDYKTGSIHNQKMRRPNVLNPRARVKENMKNEEQYGGIYYRQLVFYKILLENSRYAQNTAISGEISYLNPNGKDEFLSKKLIYKKEDVDFVKKLIKESYQKIKSHQFYEGCGESNCSWCNFINDNKEVDSFSNSEIEALDER